MSTHEEDRLVDYLYGELAEGDAQAFESALADDPELDEAVGDYAAILHAAREEAAELEPSAHLDALILAHARQAAESAAVPWWRSLLSSPFFGLAVAGTCAALIAVVLLPQTLQNEASEPLAGAPAPATPAAPPTVTPPGAAEGFVPAKLETIAGEAAAPAEAPADATPAAEPAPEPVDFGGLGLRGGGPGGGGTGVSTGLGGLGTIGHGSGGGSGYGAGPTVGRGDGASRPASRRPARRARDSRASEAERQAAQAAAASESRRRAEAEESLAKERAEEARAAAERKVPSAAPSPPPPAPAREPTPAPSRSLAAADDLVPSADKALEDEKAGKAEKDAELAVSPEARERQARAVAEAARGEALVAVRAQDPDKARRIYVKAREQTRGTLSYYRITLWLARLEFDAGRYEEAVAYGREASRTGERPVADEARRLVAASSRRPDTLLDAADADEAR